MGRRTHETADDDPRCEHCRGPGCGGCLWRHHTLQVRRCGRKLSWADTIDATVCHIRVPRSHHQTRQFNGSLHADPGSTDRARGPTSTAAAAPAAAPEPTTQGHHAITTYLGAGQVENPPAIGTALGFALAGPLCAEDKSSHSAVIPHHVVGAHVEHGRSLSSLAWSVSVVTITSSVGEWA